MSGLVAVVGHKPCRSSNFVSVIGPGNRGTMRPFGIGAV
ncbi:hypothetical protein SL1157_0810 [Ruegeria lacuscaerulensis ITI-1157]|nr:hypothetical protein SL1157_0810 [Ruegeria lacuscaerulensis ITI-1157]